MACKAPSRRGIQPLLSAWDSFRSAGLGQENYESVLITLKRERKAEMRFRVSRNSESGGLRNYRAIPKISNTVFKTVPETAYSRPYLHWHRRTRRGMAVQWPGEVDHARVR